MTTYTSTDDVFTLLRTDPTPQTEAIAALLLEGLESDVAAFLRRPLGVADYVESYDHPGGNLLLYQSPVITISQVTYQPTYTWDPDFVPLPGVGPTPLPSLPPWKKWGIPNMQAGRYVVSYTAGLDNASIRSFILRKAAEHLQPLLRTDLDMPLGVSTVTVEGTAFTFVQPGNLDPSEFEPLRRFRRVGIR